MSDKAKKLSKLKPYIVSCLIALGIGGFSALITAKNMDIYSMINIPPLAPPSFVFPIGWTILYILMGIGCGIIYTDVSAPAEDVSRALKVYSVQLILNGIWSVIFFNAQAYLIAFIWLLALLVSIILMIVYFKKINNKAAYLQFPYMLWVIFAGYLNLMIYILN